MTNVVFGVPTQHRKGKPWLALKPGETTRQWQIRVNHSCFQCGLYEQDMKALSEHESGHDARGHRPRGEP